LNNSWYAPQSISYKKDQILFLLKHLSIICDGNWISPDGSILENNDYELLKDTSIAKINGGGMGSSPPASERTLNKIYYQDKVLAIFNELDARLKACSDGELIIARYANRVEVRDLCRLFSLERQAVYRRCRLAVKYISGKQRKRTDYKSWLKNRD